MNKDVSYRDLDLSFSKHPTTADVSQFQNTEAVKHSLRNLLSLKRFEKPFHPEINCGIYDLLFESTNPIYLDNIKGNIKSVIQKYEPRVTINDLSILPNYDGNSISVVLNFTVKNYQTPISFTVNLVRNR